MTNDDSDSSSETEANYFGRIITIPTMILMRAVEWEQKIFHWYRKTSDDFDASSGAEANDLCLKIPLFSD